jgi:hypothetical protein
MQTDTTEDPGSAVVDRPGERRGFLGAAWPVLALAMLLLLLLRACAPLMQGTTAAPAPVPAAAPPATR